MPNIIVTRMFDGKLIVHVLNDERPEEYFQPVNPDLEDVYFSMIKGDNEHAA